MRKHADWVTQTDERILEFINEKGTHPPKPIRDGLAELSPGMDYSIGHIRRECRKLRDGGLLQTVGRGVYAITPDGEAFLSGELNASTLESPNGEA